VAALSVWLWIETADQVGLSGGALAPAQRGQPAQTAKTTQKQQRAGGQRDGGDDMLERIAGRGQRDLGQSIVITEKRHHRVEV